MTKLRVLRVTHTATLPTYRDRERALVSECGFEVLAVAPNRWQHLGDEPDKLETNFRYEPIKIVGRGSIPLFAFDPLKFISLLQEFMPDVVDIHEEPYSVSGFEALILAKKFAPQAACVFYSAQNINKQYPIPFSRTEKYVYDNADGAYPCSISVKAVLTAKGFRKHCPVIPLGVNETQFHPGIAPFANTRKGDEFIVGFTGRIEEYKGIGLVIQAVANLRRSNPGQNFRVLICGSGSGEEKFRSLAKALDIEEKTTFLGAIPASKMPAFYTSCDAIVIPSLTTTTWKEQFGRVPVEAMACGIPVIASDSGSLPEVVADCGLIVPESSCDAIATSLLELRSDPEKTKLLIQAGLRRVQENYAWKKIARDMSKLYEHAISTKRAKSDRSLTSELTSV